jgi:hypothetical protein
MQIKTVTAIARFFLPFDQLRRWLFVAIWIGLAVFTTPAADLTNDLLTLRLAVTAEGVPAIKEVLWRVSGRAAFRDTGTPAGLNAWVPEALLPTTPTPAPEWIIKTGDTFITAEATRELANKISMTWVIDLPKRGSLFRLRVRLTNRGQLPQDVEWVPAWAANWDLGEPALWMRWWQALDYDRTEEALKPEQTIQLYSQAQSSDDADAGVNPYWIVGGKMNRLYLGLSWCGGWRAVFKGLKKGFNFSAYLPPEESYLV